MSNTIITPNETPVNHYTERFRESLQKETGDLELDNYCYAGGDSGHHSSYLATQRITVDRIPPKKDRCLCGHPISENCYIKHIPTQRLIVVGNCCIKRYLDKSGRTCEKCNKPHKNRKNNLCESCGKTHKISNCSSCNSTQIILKDNVWCNRCIAEHNYKIDVFHCNMKIFINVKFADKDEAKRLGAKWEPTCKCWYIEDNWEDNNRNNRELIAKFPLHPTETQTKYRELLISKLPKPA